MSELRPALPSQLAAEDEIDLRELFGLLWAGRALIVGVTAVAAVVSVVVALVMTEIYRAEATLVPAGKEQASGSLAQFGGAAALLGVSLPGGGGHANNQHAAGPEQAKQLPKIDLVLGGKLAWQGWS